MKIQINFLKSKDSITKYRKKYYKKIMSGLQMTLKKIKINEHFQKKIYYEYIYIYKL